MMVNFWEVVRRAENGPKVEGKEVDLRHVSLKIMELQKEHDIHYDPDILVPSDNGLADSVWQAAMELLLHSGVYYNQTGRVMKFTEEEIKEELGNAPSRITLGEGEDTVTIKNRTVEDSEPPFVFGGPF